MSTPTELKVSDPMTTYWVMEDKKIVHVTLEVGEAEKVMARLIETEALKALGITAEKLKEAIESVKSTYSLKKAKTSFDCVE